MINESAAIVTINKYLIDAHASYAYRHFPVTAPRIYKDHELCDDIIDFLGDIYVRTSLDMDNKETECGSEIMDVINFLAFCNGKEQLDYVVVFHNAKNSDHQTRWSEFLSVSKVLPCYI